MFYKCKLALLRQTLIFHESIHCREYQLCSVLITMKEAVPVSAASTLVCLYVFHSIKTNTLLLTEVSAVIWNLSFKFPLKTLRRVKRQKEKKGWNVNWEKRLWLSGCENSLVPEVGRSAADFLQFASQIRIQLFLCVGLRAGGFLGSHV